MYAIFMILVILLWCPARLHGPKYVLESPAYHLCTHAGNLICQKCFLVLHADQLLMSHAVDCIYLKTAPLLFTVHSSAHSCQHMLLCSNKVLRHSDRLTSEPIT